MLDFQAEQKLENLAGVQAQPVTYISVVKTDFLGLSYYMDGKLSGMRNAHIVSDTPEGNEFIFAGVSLISGSETTDLVPHIFALVFDGANSLIYKDGLLIASGDAGTNNINGLRLGRGSTDSFGLNGFIAEHFMYGVIITNSEINQTANYLAAKWDLPWTDIV